MIPMQTLFLSYIWLIAIFVCLATCNNDLSNGVNPFDINFFKVKRKNSKLFFADPFIQKSPMDNNLTRSDFYLNSIMSNSFNNDDRLKNPTDNLNSRLTASNSMTTSSSQSSILINNLNSMKSEKFIDYIKAKSNHHHNHFNRPIYNLNNELNYQQPYEDIETSLECKLKIHKFKAVNTDEDGRKCWGIVRLQVCWGRCDTGEYPDYLFPYKKSFHHVCIHREMRIKTALLKYCDPGVDENLKIYSYIDAQSCACAPCSSSEISCESTDFLATIAPFR